MAGFISVAGVGYATYHLLRGYEPLKYSTSWIRSLSGNEWKKEREIIRKQMDNYDGDWLLADKLEKILYKFDRIMSARKWDNEPEGFPKGTTHGWYLSDDD